MTPDDAIEVLTLIFGGVVEVVAPSRGFAANLAQAVDAAELVDTSGGWLDVDPLLSEYLADADEAGALDAYRAGLGSGHGWAPCDVCGEVTLRPRGPNGRTASGGISRAAIAPVGCRMTPGCGGKHR